MNVALLLTGDELMSGDITDTNSTFICQQLTSIGIQVSEKRTVGDNFDHLVVQINQLSQHHDVVIINGGLGPTSDDLTAAAVAKASDDQLSQNLIANNHVIAWCQQKKLTVSDANLKQAELPSRANILANPIGSAVGFVVKHNGALIISTPGVPSELIAMMPELISLLPQAQLGLKQNRLKCYLFGKGEAAIQQILRPLMANWSTDIKLGFRACWPYVELKLTFAESNQQQAETIWQQIMAQFAEYVLPEQASSLAQALQISLLRQNKSMTTVESCTGGLIASEITANPGSSAIFPGALVTYSNTAKTSLVGVSDQTLQQFGAVSEATVLEMARGGLKKMSADLAIAVSGIAGPDGGSDDKPVGTVWIAYGDKTQLQAVKLIIPLARRQFQQMVVAISLDLLRRFVCGLTTQPSYLSRWQGKTG